MTRDYVVLDLETTGLQPAHDKILEIGAIKVEKGKVIDTYHTLIDPHREIPFYITNITGITTEMVRGQKENDQAVAEFLDFCGDLPLLGHNILFDYSFIKTSVVSMKRVFEKAGIDTLRIARVVLPELESRSLQSLRAYYQIPQDKAHRALDDSYTTYVLYEKFCELYGVSHAEMFRPMPLLYKAKKQSSITNAQKRYLQDLLKYHKINLNVEIDKMTKSEASRTIDTILATYGKIMR